MEFLAFFLVYHYLLILFYKWDAPKFIRKLQKTPLLGRFFYDLSECEFCMENHIAFAFAAPIYIYTSNLVVFLFAIMATALSQLLKTRPNDN